jgi:hypothetical protein
MPNQPPQVQYPPFKIHSRTGSVQFTLKPAHFDGETFAARSGEVQVLKKGHLMVEMANAAERAAPGGPLVYDWAGKVVMKLSDTDIQHILSGLAEGTCQIVHDPNKARGGAGSLPKSRLQLRRGERFGYFMSLSRGDQKAHCPISDTDAASLRVLLQRALVRIYGW